MLNFQADRRISDFWVAVNGERRSFYLHALRPVLIQPIRGTLGKQCEDGSVWERDKSGHGNRDGDGDQWKRWPNKGYWE